MITVAVGGTFNILHKGHEALLIKAFELGELIHIGLTTDEFANTSRSFDVRPYDARRKALLKYLKSMGVSQKFTIVPIKDTYGLTLEKDLDFLVVSPETVRMADKINYIREEEGRTKIRIVVVEYVMANDGKPISSTRVANHEINPDGSIETVFTEDNFPEELIRSLNLNEVKPSLLMHICCAPCLAYPLSTEFEAYAAIGYFYNQNIHPFQEYRKRVEALKDFTEQKGFRVIYNDDYDLKRSMEGMGKAGYEREDRCRWCYQDRLERTAKAARKLGIGSFTTTLLSSPHQLHEMVREIGEKVAETYNLYFVDYDTRDHYIDGANEVRDLDLHVQNYCGCIFSESDRFQKKLI